MARIRGAEATSERILKRIINKDIYQFQWLVGWLVEEKKKKSRLSLVNWRGGREMEDRLEVRQPGRVG